MHRIRNTALMGMMAALAVACGSTTADTVRSTPRRTSEVTSPAYDYTPPTADDSWRAGAIETSGDISDTLDEIANAADATDISGTMSLCTDALGKIVTWESSFDSIPEETVRRPAQLAVAALQVAFGQCADGEFSDSADTTRLATSYLHDATAAVEALG